MVADMLDKVDNKFGGTAAADDLRKIVYDTYIDYLPDGSSASLAHTGNWFRAGRRTLGVPHSTGSGAMRSRSAR